MKGEDAVAFPKDWTVGVSTWHSTKIGETKPALSSPGDPPEKGVGGVGEKHHMRRQRVRGSRKVASKHQRASGSSKVCG